MIDGKETFTEFMFHKFPRHWSLDEEFLIMGAVHIDLCENYCRQGYMRCNGIVRDDEFPEIMYQLTWKGRMVAATVLVFEESSQWAN